MRLNHSNQGFEALVVGRPDIRRGRTVTLLLGRLGIEYVFCNDIYAAVARLASIEADRPVLVISALEEIAAERMRFFDICRSRGNVRICCFVRRQSQTDHKTIHTQRWPALIVEDVEQLKPLIETLTADFEACCLNPRKTVVNYAGLMDPDLSIRNHAVLSRAELNALLGGE